jgi:hypothetical protein
MKRMVPISLSSLMLLGLLGCGSMNFTKYAGDQTAWPAGSSFSDKVYAVPVFRGWPERPYEVLGVVQFNNPNIDWNEGDVKQAAGQAKAAGGEAIILMPKGTESSPTSAALRTRLGITGGQTVAVVLKWK